MNLAATLTKSTGEAGGGRLFKDFIKANDPQELQEAIAAVNAELERYAQKTAAAKEQEQQQADAIAATKSALDEKTKAIQTQMASLDDELKKLDASEAPEEHMGTVERLARERIAREKDDLQRQLQAAQEAAKAAIEAVGATGEASTTDLKTQGEGVIDGLRDGFLDLGTLTQEQLDAIRQKLAELGRTKINIPVGFELPDGVTPGHMPDVLTPADFPVIPMPHGGFGRVTAPTLFLAGDAGPEDFAFSGANRTFSAAPAQQPAASVVFNDGAIQVSLPRGSAPEQARAFLRALRHEVERGGTALDDLRALTSIAGA
jgi:hypothetical protein